MDDFDNFFNNEPEHEQQRTPLYHTPGGSNEPSPKQKRSTATIVWMVIAIVMCVIVVVNVVVLASLKSQIANEYEQALLDAIKSQYSEAIDSTLANGDIVQDVTDAAADKVVDNLSKTIGEVGAENAKSVAVITAKYTSGSTVTTGSGFLISDSKDNTRYLVTCAHVVMGVVQTSSGSGFIQSSRYSFKQYDNITCTFDDDTVGGSLKTYYLEIVAVGEYYDSNVGNSPTKTDLAVLRFKSGSGYTNNVPDDTAHPSLSVISSDDKISVGEDVALIGDPQGIGISIATGTVSKKNMVLSDWGVGTFILTDAAINSGNSGGPMLDRNGNVIGVVESKLASSSIDNMGFAISTSTLQEFISYAENGSTNNLGTNVTINYSFGY